MVRTGWRFSREVSHKVRLDMARPHAPGRPEEKT
jgi:hypothetical protein